MNWKTLVMLPAVGLSLWIVVSAIEFGNAVGSTWTEGTTATIVNGLVMVCFSGVLLFAIIGAALIGVALATRILQTPMPKGSQGSDRGYGAPHRPGLWDRMRGRTGPGWEDPVLSDLENGGRIVGIEPPLPGMRPMLQAGRGVLLRWGKAWDSTTCCRGRLEPLTQWTTEVTGDTEGRCERLQAGHRSKHRGLYAGRGAGVLVPGAGCQ